VYALTRCGSVSASACERNQVSKRGGTTVPTLSSSWLNHRGGVGVVYEGSDQLFRRFLIGGTGVQADQRRKKRDREFLGASRGLGQGARPVMPS